MGNQKLNDSTRATQTLFFELKLRMKGF